MEGSDANENVHLFRRVLRYREHSGGPVRHGAPGNRVRQWGYVDERRRLATANRRAQMTIARLRRVTRMQGDRIRELEASVLEEQGRTNALQEQLDAVNGRLVQVVGEVRDRANNILVECGMLIGDVVHGNEVEGGQGNVVPNDAEQEPEEEPAAPEEESIESVTS